MSGQVHASSKESQKNVYDAYLAFANAEMRFLIGLYGNPYHKASAASLALLRFPDNAATHKTGSVKITTTFDIGKEKLAKQTASLGLLSLSKKHK